MARGKSRDGIRALGPGRWEVLVSWRDPDGSLRQKSKTVHGTRRDAERVRDELRLRQTGLQASTEDLASILTEWIELHEPTLSPSTVDVYLHAIRRRLIPALGDIKVAELSARQLDRYYVALHEEGLAPGTIAKLHSIIRSALDQARKWGLVARNVADDASPPRNLRRPVVAVSAEAVAQILEASRDWFATKTNRHGTVSTDAATVRVLQSWRSICVERALACGIALGDDAFLFSPQPDGSIPRWPKDVDYEFRRSDMSFARLERLLVARIWL